MKLQKHYNYWHQWLFLSLSSLRNFKVKQMSSFAHWVMQRKDYLPNLWTLKTNNITGTWQLDTSTDFCSGTYVPTPQMGCASAKQERWFFFLMWQAFLHFIFHNTAWLHRKQTRVGWLGPNMHQQAKAGPLPPSVWFWYRMETGSIFLALDYLIQPCSSLSNMACLDFGNSKIRIKRSHFWSVKSLCLYIYKEFQKECHASTSFFFQRLSFKFASYMDNSEKAAVPLFFLSLIITLSNSQVIVLP